MKKYTFEAYDTTTHGHPYGTVTKKYGIIEIVVEAEDEELAWKKVESMTTRKYLTLKK